MMRLWEAWRRYWFRPAPLVNLAVGRIALVFFQLYGFVTFDPLHNLYRNLVKLPEIYQPLAVLRLLFRPMGTDWFPTFGFLTVVFWVLVVSGLLALIGLATNLSLALFALSGIVLQAYTYSFNELHHGEAIMSLALTIMCLSPCGQVLSVDALIRSMRRNLKALKFQPVSRLTEESENARWPVLAILWLFSLIYASAAYYKLVISGFEWLNGDTLRYYLLQDGLRWGIPTAIWLAKFQWFALISSYFSALFEAFFFVVLFIPQFAWAFALFGLGLHIGIHFLMRASFWEYMVLYLAVIPWNTVGTWVKARLAPFLAPRRPEMVYDGECFICLRSMTFIDAVDWLGMIRFAAFQEPGVRERCAKQGVTPLDTRRELHLFLPNGEIRRGFFAVRRMAWFIPALLPFAPFLYLPGATFFGTRVYRLVANSRRRFEVCENDACKI